MKTIYLVRHCPTKDTEQGINNARVDTPLSEKGQIQADNLVAKISENKYDLIIVSPLQRTYQTVKPYLSTLERPIQIITDELCTERDLGKLTGTVVGDGVIPNAIEESGLSKTEWKPEGGESTKEVYARATKFFEKLKDYPSKSILICSHQNFLRCLELVIQGKEVNDENFYSENPPRLETGEIRKYVLN